MPNYRILSLDGGGTWSLLQIMALQQIYGDRASGRAVLKNFDLAVANSGGSIVLGGMIVDKPLDVLRGYFEDETLRSAIFAAAPPWERPLSAVLRLIRLGIGARYSATRKLEGLRKVLGDPGDRPLSALADEVAAGNGGRRTEFVIVGFDYDSERAYFFRSNTGSTAASGAPAKEATLAEAIHASANPPVNYFDAPAGLIGRRFWDGAIAGYNNPLLAGLTEALSAGVAARDIAVLSIGSAATRRPVLADAGDNDADLVLARQSSSFKRDLVKLASSILDDPPDAASFITHAILNSGAGRPVGQTGNVIRMNAFVHPDRAGDRWTYPPGLTGEKEREKFRRIFKIDMDAVKQDEVNRIKELGEWWISGKVRNQPVRADGDSFACQVGHDSFADAQAAWRLL